jgi:anaerobic magnesium-protoporphyrin IX monomethyl ester cyclase
MTIKFIFIDPPQEYLMQERTQAPLGLMYLAAVLRENGHESLIARPDSGVDEDLDRDIPEGDVYAISTTSLGYGASCDIARFLKIRRKNSKVIIGGYHVTCEPESVQAEPLDKSGSSSRARLWDAICIGEAEGTILRIAKDLESHTLKERYQQTDVVDLDKLPLPARDLIENQGGNIFAYDKHFTDSGKSTVISSCRGCPYKCVFCSTAAMWGRSVRYRSGEGMLEEIQQCITEYGIREFRFSDELFTVNRKRTLALMEFFKKENIFFKCSTRVDRVDEELLEAMKAGGCKEIAFGVESFDPVVREAIAKGTGDDDIERALTICDNIGVDTRVLLMIGTPGERLETPDINIQALEELPWTCAALTVFMPLPGSPSWIDPESCGIKIKSNDLSRYNIYLWEKGNPNANRNDDVVELLTLPSVSDQIGNQEKMIQYFLDNGKMNEISRAKEQTARLSSPVEFPQSVSV